MALILLACEESQAVTIELKEAMTWSILLRYTPDVLTTPRMAYTRRCNRSNNVKEARHDDSIPSMYSPSFFMSKALCTENKRLKTTTRYRFFIQMINADIPRIAVENPVWVMSNKYRKPDQIIQPRMFWDKHRKQHAYDSKPTKLEQTDIVGKWEFYISQAERSYLKGTQITIDTEDQKHFHE